MATPWSLPTTITQVAEAENHIPWDSSANFYRLKFRDGVYTKTLSPLHHIPNSFSGDRTEKTYYLYFTGYNFQFTSDALSGIQVKIRTDRGGRIVDDTVQLIRDGQLIGENKADARIESIKYYGGQDTWGLDLNTATNTATIALATTSTFGIALRMRSHPHWPHTVSPMLDYVEIRFLSPGDDPGRDPEEQGEEDMSGRGRGGSGYGDGSGKKGNKPQQSNPPLEFNPGLNNPYGYAGSFVSYQGSQSYSGSTGFIGSSTPGFTGSSGYVIPPNSLTVQTFADLPITADYYLQAAYIVTTGQVYQFDNAWVLVYTPPT